MTENITTQSGYTPCACRDCMDVTVSSDMAQPELCEECTEAGCEPYDARTVREPSYRPAEGDCQRVDAYATEESDMDAGTGHGAYEYR